MDFDSDMKTMVLFCIKVNGFPALYCGMSSYEIIIDIINVQSVINTNYTYR